jgi:hypothetical protein
MKILSIRQPWAELIVRGIKDIENRDWLTRFRGPLLIHAGKKFEDESVYRILDMLDATERQRFPMKKSAFECGGIVGIVRMVDCVTTSESKWFVGDYGWRFERAQPLPFMPLRGSLGLFDAPPEIVAQVRDAFSKSLPAMR